MNIVKTKQGVKKEILLREITADVLHQCICEHETCEQQIVPLKSECKFQNN